MRRTILFFIMLVAFSLSVVYLSAARLSVLISPAVNDFFNLVEMDEMSSEDIFAERYWRMIDEEGEEITVTGRRIHVGDEYITPDNKLYRVYKVSDRTAYARFIREIGAVFSEEEGMPAAMIRERIVPAQNDAEEDGDLSPETAPQRLIGIYHTHNAESYVPTDGTDSINGQGGIHEVGASFSAAMEEKNITVIHDQTLHLPHDRGAYRRSRATTERLLEKGPDVIFDIHRDAAPRHAYATQIEDEWVTQVQFVVGRQNPNMAVTRQFALDLKRSADQIHPGLVRGIFMAHGNYNQDLTPLNLLLEVGAHTNSREAAEDGAVLFADVVAFYFYGPEEERQQAFPAPVDGAPGAQATTGIRAAARNILWILVITLAIAIGFLLINTGSWQELREAAAPRLVKIQHRLEPGDRYLARLQIKIETAAALLLENTSFLLQQGDGKLELWQKKIREVALTLKKYWEEWYRQIRDRDKLR